MYTIYVKKEKKIITVINLNYAYLLHYLFIRTHGKIFLQSYGNMKIQLNGFGIM